MTKIDVRNELRNLKRFCRTPAGKESELYKKYNNLFNDALDDFEKYIMKEHFIKGKTYYQISFKINSSERTVKRIVNLSIDKIKEQIKNRN